MTEAVMEIAMLVLLICDNGSFGLLYLIKRHCLVFSNDKREKFTQIYLVKQLKIQNSQANQISSIK